MSIISCFVSLYGQEIQDHLEKLELEYGSQPFSEVLPHITAWIEERGRHSVERAREYDRAPRYSTFNKITLPNGEILRDWWPAATEATIKAWIRKHHYNKRFEAKIEYRQDIEYEGDNYWFAGKMSGRPAESRFK